MHVCVNVVVEPHVQLVLPVLLCLLERTTQVGGQLQAVFRPSAEQGDSATLLGVRPTTY